MDKQITSPIKAIRAKCLDCSAGSNKEVRECPVTGCALHAFRSGRNPYRKKRQLTDEQKNALNQRLKNARKAQADPRVDSDAA